MVQVQREVAGPLSTNVYLVFDEESKEAMLIDVADNVPQLLQTIVKKNLKVKYIFFTHGHFDHVMGKEIIKKQFSEAQVGIHKEELDTITHSGPFAKMFGFKSSTFAEADIYLENNEEYRLGKETFQIILAPGHTKASLCFYFPVSKILFSGDVIFKEGIGRTDLYGGNFDLLVHSIKRLFELPSDTLVYSGHGEEDVLENIKRRNFIGE